MGGGNWSRITSKSPLVTTGDIKLSTVFPESMPPGTPVRARCPKVSGSRQENQGPEKEDHASTFVCPRKPWIPNLQCGQKARHEGWPQEAGRSNKQMDPSEQEPYDSFAGPEHTGWCG